MTGTPDRDKDHQPARRGGQKGISGPEFAGAGLQFAIILVLSAFAGLWLDREVGTSPWLLIFAVFAGAALAFYSLYHRLMKGQEAGERRTRSRRGEDR
jgi:F0F1-type ATP synthase assembly protein I